MVTRERQDSILTPGRGRFGLDNINISDFNAVQTSCKMNLNAPSWNWHVFLHISICCPASSSGQAAYNSKSTIVIPSCFRNVQFEIRAGGGRTGLEEAGTQIQTVQSANLILNPCLMVPITAPQTSVLAEVSKFKHISSVCRCSLSLTCPGMTARGHNPVSNHEGDTKHFFYFSGQARNQKLT